MLSSFISVAAFLLGVSEVIAAPQASGSLLPLPTICATPTYGPFRLIATREDTGVSYPVRLAPDSPVTSSSTNYTSTAFVDTNSTCVDCGTIPSYWSLKDMDLIPVDTSLPRGFSTINQDVESGSDLSFITSRTSEPNYPQYCAVHDGASATHYVLAVHGSSTLFTMCAFTSVFPPATKFTLIYNHPNFAPVGESCYAVKLSLSLLI